MDSDSSQKIEDILQRGNIVSVPQAHGHSACTSASWTVGPTDLEENSPGLMASSGLDKDFKSWKLASNKVDTADTLSIPDCDCGIGRCQCDHLAHAIM